eukprot:TRINITY_DN4768_c0_g3_i1.p1 TRINITY_DN4768_c0_g3~~TRINITY_DN4768_c0_g3_i1.p1  ORF type:complete len:174 (+),score=23.55 TRINITY_DN4768_c0_g3_i1:649-1170(+)
MQNQTDENCADRTDLAVPEYCKQALTCPKTCMADEQCMAPAFCSHAAAGDTGRCTTRLAMCAEWSGRLTKNVLDSDANSCYERSSLGHVCAHSAYLFKITKWGTVRWALPLETAAVNAETYYWKLQAEELYADLQRTSSGDELVPDIQKSTQIPGTNQTQHHPSRPTHKLSSV